MVSVFLSLMLGTLMGFIPTFGILYVITSRFQDVINEEDTMKTFVLGIFAGILVTLGHLFVIADMSPENTGPFLLYSYLLATAEALLWRVYIRRKKFRDREDRPFILLSFSLGISGLYLLFTFGQLLFNYDTGGTKIFELILGFGIFSVAVATLRAGMALLFIRGEMKKKTLVPFAIIIVVFGTFNLLSMVYLAFGFLWTFALILVPFGLISFGLLYPDLKKVPPPVKD
jgi:mannose/fructose/N-acetylgalactosamine-specific phosphotransferase system component IIC